MNDQTKGFLMVGDEISSLLFQYLSDGEMFDVSILSAISQWLM